MNGQWKSKLASLQEQRREECLEPLEAYFNPIIKVVSLAFSQERSFEGNFNGNSFLFLEKLLLRKSYKWTIYFFAGSRRRCVFYSIETSKYVPLCYRRRLPDELIKHGPRSSPTTRRLSFAPPEKESFFFFGGIINDIHTQWEKRWNPPERKRRSSFLETSNRKEPGAEVLSRRKPAIHLPTITV